MTLKRKLLRISKLCHDIVSDHTLTFEEHTRVRQMSMTALNLCKMQEIREALYDKAMKGGESHGTG